MTTFTYRKLEYNELTTLVQLRVKQLSESCPYGTIDLTPAMLDFYIKHYKNGTFISWVALDKSTIISTSGMTLVERPPHYNNPTGKIGLLSNMYTEKAYRRQGIATNLLNKVIEEARTWGCGVILIDASDLGTLLYTDFGFQHRQNYLQYFL